MKFFFRRLFYNNAALYKIWFFLFRKRKGLPIGFFQKDTQAYIDGYPRSGNTFIIHLIRKLVPELKVVHHLHTVASLKIAISRKIPVVILIRDPLDSISSNYLKHFSMRKKPVRQNLNKKLLYAFVDDYIDYYSYVLSNRNYLHVIDFNDLIKDPERSMHRMLQIFNIKKKITPEEIIHACETYKGATDTMGSSKPNPVKENFKNQVKKSLLQTVSFEKALSLYKQFYNKK